MKAFGFAMFFLGISLLAHAQNPRYEKCQELYVEITTSDETTDNKGSVGLNVKNRDKKNFKYIFYRDNGFLISKDFGNNKIDGLNEGTYHCTILYDSGCKKQLTFEILKVQ